MWSSHENSLYRASSYYNIEDILATAEKVPCVIKVTIPTVGKLNQSKTTSADLVANTNAEMPLWLVKTITKEGLINPILPTFMNTKYRSIYKADPSVHNVKQWSPYFYQIVWHYLDMNLRDAKEIADSVSILLTERMHMIMSSATFGNESITIKAKLKMDELEQAMFQQAYKARIDNEKWLTGAKSKIEPPLKSKNLKRSRPKDEYF